MSGIHGKPKGKTVGILTMVAVGITIAALLRASVLSFEASDTGLIDKTYRADPQVLRSKALFTELDSRLRKRPDADIKDANGKLHSSVACKSEAAGPKAAQSNSVKASDDMGVLSLLDDLFLRPHTVSLAALEGPSLNPHSVPGKPNVSELWSTYATDIVEPLGQMFRQLPLIRDEELHALASGGHLRELLLSDDPEIESARSENRRLGIAGEPMFHGSRFYKNAGNLSFFVRNDGKYYGCAPADLAWYSSACSTYAEQVADAVTRFVLSAHAIGNLSDADLSLRLFQVDAWRRARAKSPWIR